MRALIGCTGFVGQNLQSTMEFDRLYNSRNIAEIRGEAFELIVCCGAPAEMWLANNWPDADRSNIAGLIGHLRSCSFRDLVLVSTIAVLTNPAAGYDERTARYGSESPYGQNRRFLEEALSAGPGNIHIVRLPALFGAG